MAGSYTWADVKAKVEADSDLAEETFIQSSELLGYGNEALRVAEKIVNGIYEDYFLASQPLALTQNVSTYDLPTDIFANQIRKIIYDDGSTIYPIRFMHQKTYKFEEKSITDHYGDSLRYRYMITNTAAQGRKIVLFPKSRETSTSNVTIWYLRDIQLFTGDSSVLDIEEAFDFIVAYIKLKCWAKETKGSPPQYVVNEALQHKQDLIDSLTNMVPDDDTEIEKDMSAYEEMV